jgi:hypothetical protein
MPIVVDALSFFWLRGVAFSDNFSLNFLFSIVLDFTTNWVV